MTGGFGLEIPAGLEAHHFDGEPGHKWAFASLGGG